MNLTIISALILFLAYVLSALIYNYKDLFPKRIQIYHFDKTALIYDKINDVIANTNATRIIVFTTHNGNGMPSLLKPCKVSALYGSNIRKDTKYLYKNLNVDEHYMRMLLRVSNGEEVSYKVSEMKDSLLKAIYTEEGVLISTINKVIFTPYGMFYISFVSDTVNEWTIADQGHFHLLVSDLKNLLYESLPLKNKIINLFKFKKND